MAKGFTKFMRSVGKTLRPVAKVLKPIANSAIKAAAGTAAPMLSDFAGGAIRRRRRGGRKRRAGRRRSIGYGLVAL